MNSKEHVKENNSMSKNTVYWDIQVPMLCSPISLSGSRGYIKRVIKIIYIYIFKDYVSKLGEIVTGQVLLIPL